MIRLTLAASARRIMHTVPVLSFALAVAAGPVHAQQGDLQARVAAAPDGTVRIAFAAREGVCGDGDCVSTHGDRSWHLRHSGSDDVEWEHECEGGPVRVVIELRDHVPVRMHTYVGGHWRTPRSGGPPVTDLGTVSAAAAADLLLSFARRLPSSPSSEAIFPATLADSATIWPALAMLARDPTRPTRTREQAVFWLGQAAADVTAGLDSIAEDGGVDRSVREQAVFALSQRPRDEGVPALIQIATNNHDPDIRRKALFWLGQSGDPRAVSLFEQILTGPR